ncbi:MAG: DUF1425 domain-containing protein [Planctomycetota bacterium]|jgi:uncharacterized protein YcfL
MTKRSLKLMVLAMLAAPLSGCLFSGESMNSYVVTEGQIDVQTDRKNWYLKRQVSVEGVVSERRDGHLFVQARIQNEGNGERKLEWQIEWYDGSGLLVGKPTAWEILRLGGGELHTLQRTAPTPAAISMRLNLRPQDSVR